MVQAGVGGLDTPRTNLGDATYLDEQQLGFDISMEQSFQSPSKDQNNFIQQLQNGRRGAINLRTPRGRTALGDRRNLPPGLESGGEFTPLLKNATRNSALRNGKENIPMTPAFLKPGMLEEIQEEFSALPVESSVFEQYSRNGSIVGTPIQQQESSTASSTPVALMPRRNEGPGMLQDGNQMSLREQEDVVEKINKENFSLKLKIHFLNELLIKKGPGFTEEAIKENADLKVTNLTMSHELKKFRKTLTSAEREMELYRQQVLEMQGKMERQHADEGLHEEMDRLRQSLDDKGDEIDQLKAKQNDHDELEDAIDDLKADVREKDRLLEDREDEIEILKNKVEEQSENIVDLEKAAKDAERRVIALEEEAGSREELADAKEAIEELERDVAALKVELRDAKDGLDEAIRDKTRAEDNLEELQSEMADKSFTTKGLSRQREEKVNRLQDELEDLQEKNVALAGKHDSKERETRQLQKEMEALQHSFKNNTQELRTELEKAQDELQRRTDEKDLLQVRHDSLTAESASLQKELARQRGSIEDLERKISQEQNLAEDNERQIQDQFKNQIEELGAEIEDLQADLRDRDRLHDDDFDKWDGERNDLEAQSDIAKEKIAGLQAVIETLRQAEGSSTSKESKLHEALQSELQRHEVREGLLNKQIKDLSEDVQSRQRKLEDAQASLSSSKEELRLFKTEQAAMTQKLDDLEDEIHILQTELDDADEKSNNAIATAKRDSHSLQQEVLALKQELQNAESSENNKKHDNSIMRFTKSELAKTTQDKQKLQDQLANVHIELHSLRTAKADSEAERDELKSQLKAMQEQEETFRLDSERVELRIAKTKLDSEVRLLRQENKASQELQKSIEDKLQAEIKSASAEETRLRAEILDLQKILRGSSEKTELSAAKKHIQDLESRLRDLQQEVELGNRQFEGDSELALVRRDLSSARQRETEHLQRELAQKEVLRGLKRQITELERRSHEAEISRLGTSPQSSNGGSAQKSEIIEVRHQLATAHASLKELRIQMKEVEREAARKVSKASTDVHTQSIAWEREKDELERILDEARFSNEELVAKKTSAEATIMRLSAKVERLEKSLRTERHSVSEERSLAFDHGDLQEMLRETQSEVDSLQALVQERDSIIMALTSTESDFRSQLKRVREERNQHRSRAVAVQESFESLERRFKKARDAWETEKKSITRSVRFPNMSLSLNEEREILNLKQEGEEREKRHVKELRALAMQIEWLRARLRREEGLRADAAFAKKYMALQIDLFEACNKADLHLLKQAGITPPPRPMADKKKTTIRTVAYMIIASVRMKRCAAKWDKNRKVHDRLVSGLAVMKRAQRSSSGTAVAK